MVATAMPSSQDKLSETYSRILEQERETLERLRTLQAQRAALEMAGAGSGAVEVVARAQTPTAPSNALKIDSRGGMRAPDGFLVASILKSLEGGPGTNREIRERLETAGYRWSLTPLHVSKTLTKLVKGKKIKAEGPPTERKYRLP